MFITQCTIIAHHARGFKMSQETIFQEAQQLINDDKINQVRELLQSTQEQPNSLTITRILYHAADRKKWALARELCLMSGDNKPSTSGIESVLQSMFADGQIEEFKRVCEQSTTKPSQKIIEHIIQRAHSHPTHATKWDFVDYLCSLTTENKPSQTIIGQAIARAADAKQWDLVKKICTLNGDNKPSQATISLLLAEAFRTEQLEVFKFIFERGTTTPSQGVAEEVLARAYSHPHHLSKWSFVDYLCFLTSENKPGTGSIDSALIRAANAKKWDLVKKICTLTSANKPSRTAIGLVLLEALRTEQLEVLQFIFEHGTTNPSQIATEEVLEKAFSHPSLRNKWEFVDYLCALTVENKPGQSLVSNALFSASTAKKWDLVRKICALTSDNRPTQNSVGLVLLDTFYAEQLEVFKFIFEKGTTKPNQESVAEVLSTALAQLHYPAKWDFIDYLCSLTADNKPSQKMISEVLIVAANIRKWDLVKKLYTLSGDNKPKQGALAHALEIAATDNQLHIITDICALPADLCPGSAAIDEALVNAAGRGYNDIVSFFTAMKSDNKPTQQGYITAFLAAASTKQFHVLCQLKKIEQTLVNQALKAPPRSANIAGIISILQHRELLEASDADVTGAFINACSSGSQYLVNYFITPHNKIELAPEAYHKGLLAGVEANNGLIIVMLLVYLNQKTKILSEKSIQEALVKASGLGKNDIVDFLRPPKVKSPETEQSGTTQSTARTLDAPQINAKPAASTSPPANHVPSASVAAPQSAPLTQAPQNTAPLLFNAVSSGNLAAVKQICGKITADKPQMIDLDKALAMTKQRDITHCLLQAKRILKLHKHIAALKTHGKRLRQSDNQEFLAVLKSPNASIPKRFGDEPIAYASKLKSLADSYTIAYFTNGNVAAIKQEFSTTLNNAFKDMGEHRAKWKINLLNIALVASIIGVFINHFVNGSAFFSNTKRQDKVKDIMRDVGKLESTMAGSTQSFAG